MTGEIPGLTRAELEALQLDRLRTTLRGGLRARAALPPRLRRRRGDARRPARRSADLARFPFTTKADLRANYPFGMFAVPREQVARVHASSGTTGKPTVVGYTREDLDTWAEVMARSIRAAGGRPGDVCHVAYGYGLFTGGLGAHYGAERLGCTVVPVSGGMTERQVQLILDFEPRIIMVTPSYFLAILDEIEPQGVDPRTHQPRGRHLRRRAVDRRDAAQRRGAQRDPGGRHLRALRGDGARREPGVGRDPGRAARLGGPLPARGGRPGDDGGAARRRGGRAGVHLADQAGDAGGPLPHPRPDPVAARDGVPRLPQDAEGHRPHRRHDDRARGERLPQPGRGADPRPSRGSARTTCACSPGPATSTSSPSRWSAPSAAAAPRTPRPSGAALREPGQAADRGQRRRRGARAARPRALARQGQADQRPALRRSQGARWPCR